MSTCLAPHVPQLKQSRLEAEIWGFLEYIKPTPAEDAAFKSVTEIVRNTIKKYSFEHETEVFGSQATGLCLATSDIDIRLYKPADKDLAAAPKPRTRRELNFLMMRLHKALNFRESDYMMVRLRQARYPLISMVHKKSGLDIQIVAGNDTSHSQQLIKQYLAEYPYLYANYALFKSMLDIRGLTDVYRGGLGSYSLIMMFMARLKSKGLKGQAEVSRIKNGQPLAGKRLMAFLEFYANLDTYKNALSLDSPYSVDKHTDFDPSEEQITHLAKASVRRNSAIVQRLS